MLDAHILCGYHFAVEHQFRCAILLVVFLYCAQNGLYVLSILLIVVNGDSKEFGTFYQSVDPDGEVLAIKIDVACVEKGQHAVALQLFEVLVVGNLHLVAEVDNVGEVFDVRNIVVDSVLDAAVEVNGQHTLRACGYTAGAKRIAELVVGNFIA